MGKDVKESVKTWAVLVSAVAGAGYAVVKLCDKTLDFVRKLKPATKQHVDEETSSIKRQTAQYSA